MRTSYSKKLAVTLAVATGLTMASGAAMAHDSSSSGACGNAHANAHAHTNNNGMIHGHSRHHHCGNHGGGGSSLIGDILENVYLEDLPDLLPHLPGQASVPDPIKVGPVTVDPDTPSTPTVNTCGTPVVNTGNATNPTGSFNVDPGDGVSGSIGPNGNVTVNTNASAMVSFDSLINAGASFQNGHLNRSLSTDAFGVSIPACTPISYTTDPVSVSAANQSVTAAPITVGPTVPGQAIGLPPISVP